MITNLRLAKHAYFDKLDFTGLGRITALCGRNNSGKTRILEELNNSANRFVGVEITNSMIVEWSDILCKDRASLTGNGYNAKKFEHNIRYIISPTDIIYKQDLEGLEQKFTRSDTIFTDPSTGWSGWGHISKELDALMKKRGQSIYIGSKRALPHKEYLNSNTSPQPNGEWLLSRLSSMELANPNTEDRLRTQRIHEWFRRITGGADFNISMDRTEGSNPLLLNIGQYPDDYRPADVCGMGYRDLLTMLYFLTETTIDLVLIDEPENHMYPEMQRRLAEVMNENECQQYIVATHSSVFMSTSVASKHYYVYRNTDQDRLIHIKDRSSIAQTMSDLGYSVTENLCADLTLLVEGPGDVHIYRKLLKLYGIDNNHKVRIFPLVGDNMQHYELEAFLQDGKVIVITDKDPGSDAARKSFYAECDRLKVTRHKLSGLAIENYYPIRIIKDLIPSVTIPAILVKLETNIPVKEQIGTAVKGSARKVAELLRKDDFVGTDLDTIMLNILAEVERNLPSITNVEPATA